MADGPPGRDEIFKTVFPSCREEAANYLGSDEYDLTTLSAWLLWAGEDAWARGERWYRCGVVELDAPRRLRLTHRSGDSPLHELRFDLEPAGDGTRITLTQDNNASEEAAQHSQGNWDAMLGLLKKVVEGS